MKKSIGKVTACCLAAAMTGAFGLIGVGCAPQDEAVSYVQVDVNPSLALSLDAGGDVLSVYAENEDAQVLLYGEDLTGLSAEDAIDKIAQLSVDLGYINEDNYGVDVLVEGRADADEIFAAASASFTAAAEAEGIDVNLSSEGTFTLNRELHAVNAAYDLDLGVAEFSLILSAQAADNTLTVEAAADMDASELIAIVNDAAEAIEPYATVAYDAAVRVAQSTYENGKNSLLVTPYLLPYANILSYPVNRGLIYNLYVNAYGALDTALVAAEEAEAAAQKTAVSQELLTAVADAIGMSAEQKEAFLSEVTNYAEMNDWLDSYVKNMTADERAAVEAQIDAAMEKVQEFAATVDAGIADEYKAAFEKLCSDISSVIPDGAVSVISAYVDEFKGLVNDLQTAIGSATEPKAAAYAARDTFDFRADSTLSDIRSELSENDLKLVDNAVAALDQAMSRLENAFAEAKEQAAQSAKDYLAQLRAGRG